MELQRLNLLGKTVDCSKSLMKREQVPTGKMQLESLVDCSKRQRKVGPVRVLRIAKGMM
jgi:hypothetical protein